MTARMRMAGFGWAAMPSLLGALLLAPAVAGADDIDVVMERVERLERIIESRALRDMSQRIDALQREVQGLRGTVEEQGNQLERQSDRLRDLYDDLDRRLVDMERQGRRGGAPSSSPVIDAEDDGERADYREAFELLRELRYEEAVTAFSEFLEAHPDGRYAHTARYWLAEGEYAQRHFEQAIERYEALLEHHPESPRAAEAYLKIGYSHHELDDLDEARRVVEELISAFPESTEANQGEQLLRTIREAQQAAEVDEAEADDSE